MKGLALFPLLTLTLRQKSLIFGVEIIATLRFALPFFCVCVCPVQKQQIDNEARPPPID